MMFMKRLAGFIWILISINFLRGQQDTLIQDTLIKQEIRASRKTGIQLNLTDTDSLRKIDSLWVNAYYFPGEDGSMLQVPDSLPFERRLDTTVLKLQIKQLNARSPLEIVYHPALVRTVEYYLKKRKKYLEKLFGLAEAYYYPMFEEIFDRYGIPYELKHLAIVESALNPKAQSRMGAVGLWQFMYFTGKKYGLEMTSYLDERMSPVLETDAAARHLNDLYDLFGDWNLALAAYNSGPGNVTKAIRRSGGYKNYWNLRAFLPRETAGYIPQFQAVWLLYEFKDFYGIKPQKPAFEFIKTDTILVQSTVSFKQLTELLPVTEEELEFLNPEYRLNMIPYAEDKQYGVRLPYKAAALFAAHEETIYAYIKEQWEKREKPLPKFYTLPTYVIYRVKPGDYLGKIAIRYHTSVRKIMRWNHMRSTRLRVGQKLKIYTRSPVYASRNRNTARKTKPNRNILYHTVKQGDTLWTIARKYKVSVRNLMRWNGLKSHQLKPGKKLKILKT